VVEPLENYFWRIKGRKQGKRKRENKERYF
jgi:hypothetical protein